MVPASVNEQFVIRFCVVAQNATDDDIGKNHIGYNVYLRKSNIHNVTNHIILSVSFIVVLYKNLNIFHF